MTAPAAAVSVRPEDMRQKTDAGFSETLLKRIDLTGKKDAEAWNMKFATTMSPVKRPTTPSFLLY